MVEVTSLDSWGRCRVEGYGWTTLPVLAGRSNRRLPTFRVLDTTSPVGELRRFFVGGSPQLDTLPSARLADLTRGVRKSALQLPSSSPKLSLVSVGREAESDGARRGRDQFDGRTCGWILRSETESTDSVSVSREQLRVVWVWKVFRQGQSTSVSGRCSSRGSQASSWTLRRDSYLTFRSFITEERQRQIRYGNLLESIGSVSSTVGQLRNESCKTIAELRLGWKCR